MDSKAKTIDTASAAAEALRHIPAPNDYPSYWKLAKAAKAAGIEYGLFDAWAREGEGYNEKVNKVIWQSLKLDGRITEGTLFHLAISNGWKQPEGYQAQNWVVQYGKEPAKQHKQSAQDVKKEKQGAEIKATWYINDAEKQQAKAMDYLTRRGITQATAKKFKLGYSDTGSISHDAPALVIPYPGTHYYAERNTQTAPNDQDKTKWKYNYPAGMARVLFNAPALKSKNDIVFVVEGQLDAISIDQAGCAAVAYGGNGGDTLLDMAIADAGAEMTAKAFYIIPDNDDSGMEQAVKAFDKLKGRGCKVCMWLLPDDYHDVNDYLLKEADGLRAWLKRATDDLKNDEEQERAVYQQYTPAGSKASFLNTIMHGEPLTSTGYPGLDGALNGGLPIGFTIIGALSSRGKTTFCLQMADQMAAAGHDVLYIALEQSKTELMAKSISRILYQSYVKLPKTEEILKRAEYNQRADADGIPLELSALYIRTHLKEQDEKSPKCMAVADVLDDYTNGAGKNVYYREARGADVSASQIRQAVAEHKAKMGRSPIVIIDYLQLLSSDLMPDGRPKSKDEREILNNSIKSLTGIARDFNTIVIGISAFNRNSYNTAAAMDSFSGSGRIEYSADVLIALELNKQAARDDETARAAIFTTGKSGAEIFHEHAFMKYYATEKNGRGGTIPMALTLLKNRNGRKDVAVAFEYTPKCDYFYDTLGGVDIEAIMENATQRATAEN